MSIYAVQFEENGGSAVEDRRASLIAAMPVPTRAGYGFAGWCSDASLSDDSKVSFPYDPLAGVTLYAKWVPATDGLVYTENGAGYKVWAGSAAGAVTIPAWWKGKPVTAIGDWAFSGIAGLTSVVIPESVASIGSGAFYPCAALQNIEVKSATPPEGYSNMFQGCGSLAAISVPAASLAAYQAADAWTGYAAKIVGDTVSFNSFTVAFDTDGGTAIAPKTTSLIADIPVSLREGKALEGWYSDAAKTVKVSFPYDPLTDITLYAKWIDATEGLSYAASGSGYSVSNNAASGDVVIPAYWLGKPVTSIESWGFSGFSGTSISIPESVTQIGSSAFNSCHLTTLDLPMGLISIGANSFKDSDLTSITIPANVETIGHASFYKSKMHTVTINAPIPPEINIDTFFEVPAGLQLLVPTANLTAYKSAYGWSYYQSQISAQP